MDENLRKTGFTIPENYFSELNHNLQAKVLTDRLKGVAASDGYVVPENYFGQLETSILNKTVRERKVFRLWHSSLLKYASAACFVVLSAAGFYFYELQQPNNTTIYSDIATEQLLYDIDEEVIIDHIHANDLYQNKPSAKEAALETYILNNYSQGEIASDL